MQIDTQICKNTASTLKNWQRTFYFYKTDLNTRHTLIQKKLFQLSLYFQKLAIDAEQVEQELRNEPFFHEGQLIFDHSIGWMPKKNIAVADASISYDGASGKNISQTPYSNSSFEMNIGHAILATECEAGILNEKHKIEPHIKAEADAEASLLTSTAKVDIGKKPISAFATTTGKVGVAQAQAKAVLNDSEQSLGFSVGAAALEGEVECGIDLLGINVQLKTSGALGCAQLEGSYSHKNKEWELGCKLGFIAGLGFDLKVKY